MGIFFGKTKTKEIVKTENISEQPIINNEPSNIAVFGAGCYWGTEKFLKSSYNPAWRSVLEGEVGFMGPSTAKENPSYKEVCSGSTGHVEVFQMTFDGGDSTFEEICRFFFQFHDPTTEDRLF
jgi:methionine-S-sulfoxide reductase